jgi:hypothetical protein
MAEKVLHVAKSVIDKYLILNRTSRMPLWDYGMTIVCNESILFN